MAKTSWTNLAAFAVLALVLLLIVFQSREAPLRSMPIPAGTPLPPLQVAGWLNVDAGEPLPEGHRLVVVDCWATWCPPCRAEMPRLAELHEQYAPLGVAFVGLTSEGEGDVPKIRDFIATVPGFSWPVAYGAGDVLQQMGVRVLPTLVVFDGTGQAIWSSVGSHGLSDVLDAALAR